MGLIATIPVSNCRIATRDGEAMVFDEVVDLSPYVGKYLEFYDSAGKKTAAWALSVGGGVSFGANLLASLDFTSGWIPYGCVVDDANTFTNTAPNCAIGKIGLCSVGRIYKGSLAANATSGNVGLAGAGEGPKYVLNNQSDIYKTYVSNGPVGYLEFYNIVGSIGAVTDVNVAEFIEVTNVPATGLLLVSASGGETRNMAVAPETGFNPNAITSIRVLSRPDCVYCVSYPLFSDRIDKISTTTPTAQGNGWRYSLPSLNAGVEAALGGFVPSDVPQAEADALIAFYLATAGASWNTKTNWLTDPVVANWYGVTVVGGHVTGLALPGNNLVGNPTTTLVPLASVLTTLDLGQNTSMGPPTLTAMTALTNIDLAGCDFDITEVTALLLGIDTAGAVSGTLDIGGSNSSPDPTGTGYLRSLEDKSWTLTYSVIVMINSGTMRIVTADGSAALYTSALDISSYTDRFISVKDSLLATGKYCLGYGLEPDIAETLGSELITNGTFTAWTGDDPDSWTVGGTEDAGSYVTEDANGCNIVSDGDLISIDQAFGGLSGLLYKYIVNIFSISGTRATLQIEETSVDLIGTGDIASTGDHIFYNTESVEAGGVKIYRKKTGTTNAVISSVSVKQVTALGTTAQRIRNDATGSTRNWTTIESGFDPNATSFKIEIFPVE